MSALLTLPTNTKPIRPPAVLYTPTDERGVNLRDLNAVELALWAETHQRVYADTRSSIKALSAAIGAVCRCGRDLSIVSAARRPTRQIAGWGVVFGSAAQRDSHGTYFSRRTNLHLLRGQHLLLRWDHKDGAPIGYVNRWQLHPSYGYWFQAIVTAIYADFFMQYAATGRLHFSTAVPAADVRQTDDGEILEWPLDELSACPNPSESGVGSIIVDWSAA